MRKFHRIAASPETSDTVSHIALPPVSIVVCARNEAETIGAVLSALAGLTDDLIVVDGHSTDRTVEISEGLGARVVTDRGLGKGEAVRLGLDVARHDITLFIDADGSHDAADIPKLVWPVASGTADLVMGSRMLGGSEELFGSVSEVIRLMGSLVASLAINYRFGVRLTDYQNGFRAIRTQVGRNIGLTSNAWTIEQEMAMKCLALGYEVTERPTHERRRQGGVTKLNLIKVMHVHLWSLLRGLLVTRSPVRARRSDVEVIDDAGSRRQSSDAA